jgi:uncharacterized protein
MANHLSGEASRYLQQHAGNPVDWYPWGEAALERARLEDKPIFLSIGYSACHWCHVMAHESFEDEATAKILDAHFVSIKVDREERPDLDRIYMNAVQAMTGGGGWPMSVFLTPEGAPFYGGTYFPKEPRYNTPAFSQLLLAIAEAWRDRRDELLAHGERLVAALREPLAQVGGAAGALAGTELDPATVERAYRGLREAFDGRHGGWGGAPKFPQPMALEFLLRHHLSAADPQALAMVTQTLEAMARGGIYDQLGGGFHRYAVDANWLTPHFERMLYDSAQLARVYLHGWQVTGAPLFRAIVQETLDYVVREMTAPEGGFYATQDADTEGGEGQFYTWTADEIRAALGGSATRFLALFGVTEDGNFEGRNILTFSGMFEEREAIAGARQQLFEARAQRTPPGRDEKVLTSWNGLMLAAFAEAARVLGREDYRQVAERNADFLLRELHSPDGRLMHVWYDGRPTVPGLLEDYTYLIEGLLALYQTTFEPRWYRTAAALADEMIARFGVVSESDGAVVGFYDTPADVANLVYRPRELQDNAVPSGNAMAATVLQQLARLGGIPAYQDAAVRSLLALEAQMAGHPLAFGQWLLALDGALAVPIEVAVIGDPTSEGVRALVSVAQGGFVPHRLLAVGCGDVPELLAHREQADGRAAAYVCRDRVCKVPVTEPEDLRANLL